jgi:hypothetical protein
MPIHWTIDSRQRLVSVTAEGAITRADADGYLDAIERADAVAYHKLLDFSAATIAMDHEDVMAVGVRIRNAHSHPVGALALILSDDRSEAVARILGILAAAERPIRIFVTLLPAQRWIESLTVPETSSP